MTKVMVVDDTQFIRMRLVKLLGEHGYEVVEAEDGVQAISVYQKNRPDVVLMDITMPHKNGLEALTEIIQWDSGAKVIMLTALGQEWMVYEAFKHGAKDFLLKPYNSERLVETLQKVLG
ncbi:MAG: response regulator [Ardenticatenales bacterium]|nr:response regulator [Ardenticatenales bacterium]